MKTAQDLKKAILAMDHRGYPAYKSLAADWRFDDYILHIDHVQGDPFASPSRLSVSVSGRTSRFPSFLYETDPRRTALEDSLVRRFRKESEKVSFKAGGSGKSWLIGCSRPGQEILSRTACRIRKESGDILFRFDVGFPARGRQHRAADQQYAGGLSFRHFFRDHVHRSDLPGRLYPENV